MSNIEFIDQDILVGSSKIVKKKTVFNKHKFMVDNMRENKAYLEYLNENKNSDVEKVLKLFKNKYLEYRKNWNENAKNFYDDKIRNDEILPPQCIDIESAAICDLACPHCFREYLITPDKVMSMSLYEKIMKEIKILEIPSIKLNWRGEPLLNPNLIKMIKLAKKSGVIDVSINTNATTLDSNKSLEILESGLDYIIFSFDGGTKQTYEKHRPGRFKKNTFDTVYENIKRFCELKKEKKKLFPVTKIQMVITKENKSEINSFYNLFEDYVDDISVTPYQERGGSLSDIDEKSQDKLKSYLIKKDFSLDTPYMSKGDNRIFISEGRKPCYQPLQRLMVTFNGMVAMCCIDWGAQHCVGYLDELAFDNDNETKKVDYKINSNKKGFELLKSAKYPSKYNSPEKKISTLKEIWYGDEINKVRDTHKNKLIEKLDVCKSCTLMDTYKWKEI